MGWIQRDSGENKMSDGGKGSAPRPLSIPKEEFDNRWDQIFKQPKTDKIGDKVVKQVEESLQNGTNQVS
jgi:hypothetical protein